jgi:hypothetical protein
VSELRERPAVHQVTQSRRTQTAQTDTRHQPHADTFGGVDSEGNEVLGGVPDLSEGFTFANF